MNTKQERGSRTTSGKQHAMTATTTTTTTTTTAPTTTAATTTTMTTAPADAKGSSTGSKSVDVDQKVFQK